MGNGTCLANEILAVLVVGKMSLFDILATLSRRGYRDLSPHQLQLALDDLRANQAARFDDGEWEAM